METPETPLQFDSAEPSADAAGSLTCAVCKKTLTDTYHMANQAIVCAACRAQLVRETTGGSASGRLSRALLFGCIGAVLGAGIYYAVLALTGYEVGLIAILVGWLVGTGVSRGAGGRGGWAYQTIAVVLTYLAIVSTYVPLITQQVKPSGSLAGMVGLVGLAAALPFLAGASNIIGILIIGFALYQAWKMNKHVPIQLTGPFKVGGPAPA